MAGVILRPKARMVHWLDESGIRTVCGMDTRVWDSDGPNDAYGRLAPAEFAERINCRRCREAFAANAVQQALENGSG